MSTLHHSYAALLMLTCVSITGCRDKLQPGHYEGTLFKKEHSGPAIEPVHLDVAYDSTNRAKIEIKNRSETTIASAFISKPQKGQVLLEISGMKGGIYTLTRVPLNKNKLEKYKCYIETSTKDVELCFSKSQFYLNFMDSMRQPLLTLSGNKFKKEPPFNLENPQEISLPDSVDLVFDKNFDSRLAIERVFQAKNAATAAWLNLLPHITSNLIWHAPLPTYISGIAVVQGLTPFLLPTYWMEARNADYTSKIQQDALIIVQADIASNIEQLFYAYNRDSKIDGAHREILSSLDKFEAKVQQRGQPNDIKTSALLEFKKDLAELVISSQSKLDRVLKEDRYAISIALGMHNPEGISNISIGPEQIPIENAKIVDQVELADWASQRSFEIEQLDYLMQITQIKEIELFFYWLDPSADQKSSLGFNLIGQERIAKSQIKELEIKREQLKSTIYQNAYRVALDYNEAVEMGLKTKTPANLGIKLQELSATLETTFNEENVDKEKLRTWIQSTLAEIVQYESNLAAFRIARAKKDRLLLAGYFERLLPHMPSLGIPVELGHGSLQASKATLLK